MDERAAANKLDGIFSDLRLNPIVLGLLTKELFMANTHAIAADWWYYHTSAITERLKNPNQIPIDLGMFD